MRDEHPGLGTLDGFLPILCKSSAAPEPGEGALDNPSAWQAVFAFRRYEDASLSYSGIDSHPGLSKHGLYDTVVETELTASTPRRKTLRGRPCNDSNHSCLQYLYRKTEFGKPLRNLATIVSLISATTTEAGLKVYCDVDENTYPKGIKVDDAEIKALDIKRAKFQGEWNYSLLPTPNKEAVVS